MVELQEALVARCGKQAASTPELSHGISGIQYVAGTAKTTVIPDTIGTGNASLHYQSRTFRRWLALTITALLIFRLPPLVEHPRIRAAAVGLIFPGAGFIACANSLGLVGLLLTITLFSLSLFIWFGTGALLAPIFFWTLSIPAAYFVTGDKIFEYSDIVSLSLVAVGVRYLRGASKRLKLTGNTKRKIRNDFLPAAIQQLDAEAELPQPDGERELSLQALRDMQYVFDQSFLRLDDWTNYTIIDQFQTSALRYQLYEMIYAFGIYQGIYCPNFHGYASQGSRNTLEKAMSKKVMSFWKWESLWGKFTLDWNPVKKDNIMVTGFFTQAIMLYTANTGDMRYTKPGSLTFHVDDNAVYEHDIHSMDHALVSQWSENPYCLFPCEPSWTYTPCNLQGMTGQVLYDRVFGTNHVERILPRFRESMLTDFALSSGSFIPMRNALTGLAFPIDFGSIFELAIAMMCRGYLDDLAKQAWATFKHEHIRYAEETGEIFLEGLISTDKMDSGNYETSEYAIYPLLAQVAAEYGNEKIRLAALKVVERKIGFEIMSSGARRLKSGSFFLNMTRVKAELLRHKDWFKLIGEGPSKNTLGGPVLSEVPYPGVLVAKARSHTSRDLDIVLYPSASAGNFNLVVERLVPGQKYSYSAKEVSADLDGKVQLDVFVHGRTQVKLVPV